jgi:hypothetical protein
MDERRLGYRPERNMGLEFNVSRSPLTAMAIEAARRRNRRMRMVSIVTPWVGASVFTGLLLACYTGALQLTAGRAGLLTVGIAALLATFLVGAAPEETERLCWLSERLGAGATLSRRIGDRVRDPETYPALAAYIDAVAGMGRELTVGEARSLARYADEEATRKGDREGTAGVLAAAAEALKG